MTGKSLRLRPVILGIFLGSMLVAPIMPAMAAQDPAVTTDPTTGNVIVTLASGDKVLVVGPLVAQIAAAMQAGDAAAVKAAIKTLVMNNAANDPDLATAIYILAANSTNDQTLLAAAYSGVIEANPAAATELADNNITNPGAPAGNGSGNNGFADNGFPSGGTSGGGSTPSPN